MPTITIFEALLIIHLVMDWIFQSSWEAMNKSTKWLPLLVHCAIYTLGFVPAFWYFNLDYRWLAFLFATHVILDRRQLEYWILKMKGINKEKVGESLWNILVIGIDQTLHLAVLGIVVFFA